MEDGVGLWQEELVMVFRKRVSWASIAAVVAGAAVYAGGVSAAAGNSSVTFTSQPTSARIVTHYVVSPAGRQQGPALSASDADGLKVLWPKGGGPESLVNNTGGANGANTGSSTSSSVTPPLAHSFIGQQSSATTCPYFGHGCNPPDMALAASPRFVLQGVNMQFEVLDPSGNLQPGWPVSAQSFFGVPNVTNADGTPCDTAHKSQPFMSDPRALYDPADGRFWAAVLQVEGAQAFGVALDCPYKSSYYIAVSQTGNPNGKWNVYEFNMETDVQGQKFAADFTMLGLNNQGIYFSGDMFGENNGFFEEIFEANKAQMEAGQANFTADGFFNLRATGPGTTAATGPFVASTVQPAMNVDNSAGSSETFVTPMNGPDVNTGHFCGFFGGNFSDSCSGLVVYTLANPIGHDSGGAAPTLSATLVPTAPFLVNVPADQPSCNLCIDADDLRIPATPVVRGGVLYTAWGTAINNGNNRAHPTPGIEWAQVNLSSMSTTTNYYNFTGDEAATYPALMPDAAGNVTMLFEHMSRDVFPETRYVVRAAGDANFSGSGNLLKAGESSYRPTLCGTKVIPVCRWGDYEATSFDGSSHIWFAGQYANQFQGVNTPPVFGRNWGTWIGAIGAS
ncbi:MAG TPA: hypothetical protein VFL27_06500 [Candidatus Dormibacteraeota bacterium]|nr:hypothetical protein [Candidatus Dormibacteraeota bacterium]